jgi:hypothetical protein
MPEASEREGQKPESEARGCDADDPHSAIFGRERADGDAREEDRQDEEERAERAALRDGHAATLPARGATTIRQRNL